MGVSGVASSAGAGDPFDLASAAVAVIDAEGLIVHWSRGAEELVGRPARDVLRRPAGSLLVYGDPAAVPESLRGVDRTWTGVVTVRHRSGETVRLAVHVCRLSGANGGGAGSGDAGGAGAGDGGDWLVLGCDALRRRRHEMYQAVARALLEQSPPGVAVLDAQLRHRWVNRALAGMDDTAAEADGAAHTGAGAGSAGTAALETGDRDESALRARCTTPSPARSSWPAPGTRAPRSPI